MDTLLLTKDRFLVHIARSEALHLPVDKASVFEVALQVSRNLYQYFQADSELVASSEGLKLHTGNVITIASGRRLAQSLLPAFPISVADDKGVLVRDHGGGRHLYAFQEGLGVVCLRPLPEERLELVVWGFDEAGLRRAGRLVPMLTVGLISSCCSLIR